MEERRVDLRVKDEKRSEEGNRTTRLLFALNQEMPFPKRYIELEKELFTGGFGEDSKVNFPVYINLAENIHIGNHVVITPYFKCMSAGNMYIEDDVRIALNVSVITNNHDFYERDVLPNTSVAGNPAKIIRTLDVSQFN